MCGNSRMSSTVTDISVLAFLGCLSLMLFARIGDSTKTSDTCGSLYMLPTFNECDLYLEAALCFNDTHSVFVTMATPAGEVIHSFHMTFGSLTRVSLRETNKDNHEGLVIRSSGDISLYVHKQIGDSMVVYPIDAFSRDYETPSLTSHTSTNETSRNTSLYNGWLFILSPYSNTTINITSFQPATELTPSSSTIPTSFSPISVKLNAFGFHTYPVDTRRIYRLQSSNVFAVVLVQSSDSYSDGDSGSLCENVTMSLLDFVPPYSASGQYFFIALPDATDFSVFIFGGENTSLVLTTDLASTDIVLDKSGSHAYDVTKASSSWMSSSHPVTIFIKITLCSSNASSQTSEKLCAENGFFLPSVEHYFTCLGNISEDGCTCKCPSVFQREIDPNSFHLSTNASDFRPMSVYPLLMGSIFDVTLSVLTAPGLKNITDVIITTNTSLMIFRYNLENLNFLPGGSTLGTIHNLCIHDTNKVIVPCDDTDLLNNSSNEAKDEKISENVFSEINHCPCKFVQDPGRDKTNVIGLTSLGTTEFKIVQNDKDDDFVWPEDDEDSARPLIAVVVSLCVSIFAVFALISGYMLVEIMTRRKHVRNTKIRPFVY